MYLIQQTIHTWEIHKGYNCKNMTTLLYALIVAYNDDGFTIS